MKVAALYQHEVKLEDRPEPVIGEDEILLKVSACGLCGTDIWKIKKGSAPVGTVLGHEVVGVASQVGAKVTGFAVGDRIVVAHHVPCGQCHYCRHNNESMCPQFKKSNLEPGGFAEWLRIPAEHVKKTAFRIPDSLVNEEALFMEPLACAVRAVRRSPLLPGDRVIVVGLGSMGLILCQLLLQKGMTVLATDLEESRIQIARRFGAMNLNSPEGQKNLQELDGVDMVLLTAGPPLMIQSALQWVRAGGTIHLFASLDGEPFPTNFADFYHREVTLLTTYSSTPRDLRESLGLLATKAITPRSFGWEGFELSGITEAVQRTLGRQTIKAIIYPTTPPST